MLKKLLTATLILAALFCASVQGACVPGASPSYTADPAYAAKSVLVRLPTSNECNGVGPIGIAIDNSNNLFTCYHPNGPIYKTSLNSPLPINGVTSNNIFSQTSCSGMVYDGRYLWASTGFETTLSRYDLTQATPAKVDVYKGTAKILGLAIDSSTGDVYMSLRSTQLARFQKSTQQFQVIYNFQHGFVDGITIDAVGKYLYGACLTTNQIIKVDLKTTGYPETVVAAAYGGVDGIALASNPINPTLPPYLFVATNNGKVLKIDLSVTPATVKEIVTGGTRGDFSTTGPDGCFYATQSNSILKVTNADGTCSLSPTSPHPIVGITTPNVQCSSSVNVAYGTSKAVTFHSTSADPLNTISISKTAVVGDAAVSFSPSLPTPSLASPVDVVATFGASENAVSSKVTVTATDLFKATSSCSVTFCTIPKVVGGGCGQTTVNVVPADKTGTVQYQLMKDGVNVGAPQNSAQFTVTTPGSYSVKYVDPRTGCAVTSSNAVTVSPPPTVTVSLSKTTIYNGYTAAYGCVQATCAVQQTSNQYSYTWLPVNAQGSSVQICASSLQIGVNTLTCQVKDTVTGCIAEKTTTINVVEARCNPPTPKKVSVCHREPKKQDIVICIAEEAVDMHLKLHNDVLGRTCPAV